MKRPYVKIYLIVELILLLFLGIFYYSCGDVLYKRDSKGNLIEVEATNDVGGLKSGNTVEQYISLGMDYVNTFGIMLSNYGTALDGNVNVKIENLASNSVYVDETIPSADLGFNQYRYFGIPSDAVYNRGEQLKISVTSDVASDAETAPTVLYNTDTSRYENASLVVNGTPVEGALCMTVYGVDNVWTGSHYLEIMLAAVVLSSLVYWLLVFLDAKTKLPIYVFTLFDVHKKYGFLLQQLVAREFKTRYKRSVLGVFWSVLNPLLMMTVQYIVFSQMFKQNIDNYPVYLLSGTVVFNFFNEAVGQSMNSITGNASLITKVYLPKYVYPVTRVLSSGINLIMSLIPLTIAAIITHEEFTKAYIMAPYILLCVMVFAVGFGMMMASAMTFFRDIGFLWGIISMVWMYLTPLFYPVSIIPEEWRHLYMMNPMVHYVNAIRTIVQNSATPEPMEFIICTTWSLVMFVIGCFVFKKAQDKFVFYI